MTRQPVVAARIVAWTLGLGVGSWIGSHRQAPASWFEWLVLAALAVGSVVVLFHRPRPVTRQQLLDALAGTPPPNGKRRHRRP